MKLLQIYEPGETPAPHSDAAAVGIDLGTTHSVVAIWYEDGVQAIENGQGHSVIPSVVDYGPHPAHVGASARAVHLTGAKDTVASIKRLMGKSVAEAVALFPELVGQLQDKGDGVPRLMLGGVLRSPVEVSADILQYLRGMAELALGKEVTQAVITVPAYFDDGARTATRDAARLAGLEVLRIINEPTAAAVAYGLENEAEGIYAIYDFGGGTFDFSLLRLEKGVFQVLATAGDTALGGDDIDRAIVDWVEKGVAVPPEQLPGLLGKARDAKEKLAEEELVDVTPTHRMNRLELAALCTPFINRTLGIVAQALEDAELGVDDVKAVVLVGGSTRLHAVREAVENYFGRAPFAGIDPDRVVAFGAAIQAHQLTEGGDNLLLDVVPLSLGLETMGGIVEKLIHRNTPIPASVAQEFTTYQDGQQGMIFHVVQGEREMAEQNRSLAKFELKGIPPLPAGLARIKVTLTVDADGLLNVTAEETTTGTRQQVEVRPSYGLPVEEIERMIVDSMEHARGDITMRLLREAQVEAMRLVGEVRYTLKETPELLENDEEKHISEALAQVEKAAGGDDRELIDAAVQELQHKTADFAARRMNHSIGEALKGKKVAEM